MEKDILSNRNKLTIENKYKSVYLNNYNVFKKIIFVIGLICIILTSNVFAQEVSFLEAENAAKIWLSEKAFNSNQQIVNINKINNDGDILAYQFDIFPKGYVVLTTDKSLPPVIAYSFTGNFSIPNQQINPLKEMLISDILSRKNYLPNMKNSVKKENIKKWNNLINNIIPKRTFEQWPPQGYSSTGGWLETNWKQSSPYNNFCPMDEISGNRSVAGCPSIAMSMIINYQRNINGIRFTDDDDYYHNYCGRQYWIDDDYHEMDFISFTEINTYFDSIEIKYADHIPLNNDEIAALVFSCGAAAHQVYSSSVSGTFGVDQAHDAFLRFGYNDAVLIDDSDTSFYTHMKQNIIIGMPVHFAVLLNTGQGGHNVVSDGYNTDDYYHLNFGWGGSYNGWYLLPEEIPYNLTIVEGAVMDIGGSNVGIKENLSENNYHVTVYPNPSKDYVNIYLKLNKYGKINVNAIDNNGKLIENIFSGYLKKGNNKIIWHAEVCSGIYYISINNRESIQTKKIIIQ